ncbi:MAG: molybdopterin-dependent oxidoreductase [Bacillota bacterium]
MQSLTISLNGREVTGESGMTILELARREGVHIPTICYEPHLAPIGGCPSISSCRVCIVEDERTGALVTSCGTFIVPGMIINTASPRVLKRRKIIVELMLASHPDSCLVCPKGNRCQLRQVAAELGIGLPRFQRIPLAATINDANPFIKRDLSKCILCAKCIRACQELVVEGAVDYFRRGFTARPATTGDAPLEESECTFCGTCVAMCPTGALLESEPSYRGTAGTSVRSTCPYCGCGCTIRLKVKEGRVVRVIPDNTDPVTRGTLCAKGSYGCDFIHSPDRLTSPLVKVDDGFEAVSWEEAIAVIAKEFERIKGKHGGNSLSVFGSSKCTNEENYLLQRFARCALGTNNIDNGSRLWGNASHMANGEAVGVAATNCAAAMEKADVIMVIGADPTISAPQVGYAVKRAVKCLDAKLILIDPRETRLSMFADIQLKPKIGTDLVLLNGMARILIKEHLYNEEIDVENPEFKAFTESVAAYTPTYVEKTTGVPYGEMLKAVHQFATAGKVATIYGHGISQVPHGTETIKALANLALLAGKGAQGAGLYRLQKENNAQGACDMGTLPNLLPGYEQTSDLRSRRVFEDYWGSLPSTVGLTVFEMLEAAGKGKVKGMYVVGENPVASFPNTGYVREALSSLDFLVVQDLFLSETAELADVVLPAASFAEKEGTFTSFDGRVNWLKKAVEPPGRSLPDWEIIIRLGAAMGHPMSYASPREVREEIRKLVPIYKGIGYGMLPEEPQDDLQSLSRAKAVYRKQPEKALGLWPTQRETVREKHTKKYPFLLLIGSNLFQFGGSTRSSRAPRLRKFYSQRFVDIGEEDAEKLMLGEGDRVKIISPTGEVTAAVKISDTLPQGTLFLPSPLPGFSVGQLLNIVLDPARKTPCTKSVNVRVERIDSNE